MKKKLSNHPEGFTLVELLVVITILAILSTLAMIIYSGVQGKGRDTVRRAEINGIANAIESKRNNDGTYTFTDIDLSAEFPGTNAGSGQDPKGTDYVIALSTTTTIPIAPTTNTTWPPGYTTLSSAVATGGATDGPLADKTIKNKAWTICASLEAGTNVYCRSSLTR